jgi:hypothetical protein
MTAFGARPSLPDASAKVPSSRNSGRSALAAGPSQVAPRRSLERFANLKTSPEPLQHIVRCGYHAYHRQLERVTMTRFMFLVLERHRVVAPNSARPLAASVPAL